MSQQTTLKPLDPATSTSDDGIRPGATRPRTRPSTQVTLPTTK